MRLANLFPKGKSTNVCSTSHAEALDSKLRRIFQNPHKILMPYIHKGMDILDLGCGSGFCTFDIANMLEGEGHVIAADLQQGMLNIMKDKLANFQHKSLISLHKCNDTSIGLDKKFDFILLFYMFHEIPDQSAALIELKKMLKENGKIMIIEPKFHVSNKFFNNEIKLAEDAGLKIIEMPEIFFSHSMIAENDNAFH